MSLSLKFLSTVLILCLVVYEVAFASEGSPSSSVETALNNFVDSLKATQKTDNLAIEPPETRGGGHGGGGYGHGHGGGGGHGYGAITLDPVSIISLLALGAFLINNILQLLRANQAPAPAPPGKRSMDGVQIPEDISSFSSRSDAYTNDKFFSDASTNEPSFSKFFENVGSLYYLKPKKRNICIKKVVCRYVNAQKSREDGQETFKTRVFDFMLSAITRFIAPELSSQTAVRSDACEKFNKLCSDSSLEDAKTSVENKVYAEVSSLISTLAVKQLVG